jgi:hypothetical protein
MGMRYTRLAANEVRAKGIPAASFALIRRGTTEGSTGNRAIGAGGLQTNPPGPPGAATGPGGPLPKLFLASAGKRNLHGLPFSRINAFNCPPSDPRIS